MVGQARLGPVRSLASLRTSTPFMEGCSVDGGQVPTHASRAACLAILALLHLHDASITSIARWTTMHRRTVISALARLAHHDLVSESRLPTDERVRLFRLSPSFPHRECPWPSLSSTRPCWRHLSWEALMLLVRTEEEGELIVSRLSRTEGVTFTSLQRRLTRLTEAGLIYRGYRDFGRRSCRPYRLTEQGGDVARALRALLGCRAIPN